MILPGTSHDEIKKIVRESGYKLYVFNDEIYHIALKEPLPFNVRDIS